MSLLERLFDYFANDPLELLALLGGSRGLVFWLTLIKGRARIRAKILEEGFYNPSDAIAGLSVEVVNFGKDPRPSSRISSCMAIRPRVSADGLC